MSDPAVKVIKVEPFAVGPAQAAQLLNISLSSFYAALSSGAIGPQGAKIGKRRLFSVIELRGWVDAGMPPRRVWLQRKEK